MKKFLLLCLIASTTARADFMPPNDLHLEMNSDPTMDQTTFDKTLDVLEAYFSPLLKKNFSATLKINRLWSDPTVNASAYQFAGTWYLNMYGGMARLLTSDSFLAVACHEMGHHLSGFPFVSSWAANEGQADMFSTGACLRQLWAQVDNSAAAATIPSLPKGLCDSAWSAVKDQELCYRIMMAGKGLGDFLSDGTAAYNTPDKRVVAITNDKHPAGQCRLDTYMAASLCHRAVDPMVIPGKNLGNSRNSSSAEKISAQYFCDAYNHDAAGVRPACWFKSYFK